MDICENCRQPIGELEQRHEWDAKLVCEPCYSKLREARRQKFAAVKPGADGDGGRAHRAIGAILAAVGAIAAVIGYKMYDGVAGQLGREQSLASNVFRAGIVCCLVGMLWFAFGRMKRA